MDLDFLLNLGTCGQNDISYIFHLLLERLNFKYTDATNCNVRMLGGNFDCTPCRERGGILPMRSSTTLPLKRYCKHYRCRAQSALNVETECKLLRIKQTRRDPGAKHVGTQATYNSSGVLTYIHSRTVSEH